MRFEWLFLRWLVIIGLVAVGVGYLVKWHERKEPAHYQKVLLLQGAKSFGLPLSGIAVDPERREVYGLLGKPAGQSSAPEFFILWKGNNGRSYGVTFAADRNGVSGICEILPNGQPRTLHEFRSAHAAADSAPAAPGPDEALRSIIAALPTDGELPGRD